MEDEKASGESKKPEEAASDETKEGDAEADEAHATSNGIKKVSSVLLHFF